MKLSRITSLYSIVLIILISLLIGGVAVVSLGNTLQKVQDQSMRCEVTRIGEELSYYLDVHRFVLASYASYPGIVMAVEEPDFRGPVDEFMQSMSIMGKKYPLFLTGRYGSVITATRNVAMERCNDVKKPVLEEPITGRKNVGLKKFCEIFCWKLSAPVVSADTTVGFLTSLIPVNDFHGFVENANWYGNIYVEFLMAGKSFMKIGEPIDGIHLREKALDGEVEILCTVSSSEIRNATLRVILIIGGTMVVTIILSIVLSLLFMRKAIVDPLQTFGQLANNLAHGKESQKDSEMLLGIDELNELSEQFYIMDRMVRKRENELTASHNELSEANEQLKVSHVQLIRQEKLASIGHLAAGVAHEINNPIGYVAGNTETLMEYFCALKQMIAVYESGKSRIEIDRMRKELDVEYILGDCDELIKANVSGLHRVSEIVANLKSFSRIGDKDKKTDVDIEEHIMTTLSVAHNELKYDIDVTTYFSGVGTVYGNGGELNQVLLNILVNAAQALKENRENRRGKIGISTSLENDLVTVKIGDNGPGIPLEIREKIFDPFFTTKDVGQGTGLGLNISYDIVVNRHKGELSVECPSEGGTVFVIRLPVKNTG